MLMLNFLFARTYNYVHYTALLIKLSIKQIHCGINACGYVTLAKF